MKERKYENLKMNKNEGKFFASLDTILTAISSYFEKKFSGPIQLYREAH